MFVLNNERNSDGYIDVHNQDVPFQMFSGGAHIEIFGNNRIEFEGKYKILEYNSEQLKIKRSKGCLTVIGNNISISNLQKYAFCLTGDIDSIVFE